MVKTNKKWQKQSNIKSFCQNPQRKLSDSQKPKDLNKPNMKQHVKIFNSNKNYSVAIKQ